MKRIGFLTGFLALALLGAGCGGAAVAALQQQVDDAKKANEEATAKITELEEQLAALTEERDNLEADIAKRTGKKPKKTPKPTAKPATPTPTPVPTKDDGNPFGGNKGGNDGAAPTPTKKPSGNPFGGKKGGKGG